jgi:hypothetical protein
MLYGTVISATPTELTGRLAIPAGANSGTYSVVVTTVDGGTGSKSNAFRINYLPLPAISSINQTSGYRNSTVVFTLMGQNFQTGGTYARLYINSTVAPVEAILTSITDTRITGSVTIPASQPSGIYRLDILTLDGGSASRKNAFTINPLPKPQITAVTPASSYRNRTLVITVTGTNFQPYGGTYVNLTHPANNTDISLSLISINANRLNGTITIPPDAPTTLFWKLNVTTLDGGRITRPSAITFKQYPSPTFLSITPVKGNRATPVAFTLKGTNFQMEGTNVTFWNRTGNTVVVPTIFTVSTNQVTGSVLFPADANQSWFVNISTVDWGQIGKEKAFAAL